MLSLDPGRTPYDLHFNVFNIPVRVNPFFWLAAFLIGFQGGEPTAVLIWIGAMFFSILVHELGHAFMMRRFGYAPQIVLYQFGGLAIADKGFGGFGFEKPRRDVYSQALIIIAGPLAGFALAGLTIALIFALKGSFWFEMPDLRESLLFFNADLPPTIGRPVRILLSDLLQINILWGLLNLVPIIPLDGGQLAREIFEYMDRSRGLAQALQLSIGMAIIMAAFGFLIANSQYMGFMFAILGVSNYLTYQQLSRW